ncbi:hypothetical protein [Streptomyces cyaneofuscatus]
MSGMVISDDDAYAVCIRVYCPNLTWAECGFNLLDQLVNNTRRGGCGI